MDSSSCSGWCSGASTKDGRHNGGESVVSGVDCALDSAGGWEESDDWLEW